MKRFNLDSKNDNAEICFFPKKKPLANVKADNVVQVNCSPHGTFV